MTLSNNKAHVKGPNLLHNPYQGPCVTSTNTSAMATPSSSTSPLPLTLTKPHVTYSWRTTTTTMIDAISFSSTSLGRTSEWSPLASPLHHISYCLGWKQCHCCSTTRGTTKEKDFRRGIGTKKRRDYTKRDDNNGQRRHKSLRREGVVNEDEENESRRIEDDSGADKHDIVEAMDDVTLEGCCYVLGIYAMARH